MRSFKDYPGATEEETLQKMAEDYPSEDRSSAAELTKKIATAYRGKSNGEMLASILKHAGTIAKIRPQTGDAPGFL